MNAKVIGIFALLLALCGFLSIYTPESFLKGNNIENLLRRTSMYGILGIGVAFVIITSGIDLSVGSLVCLVGCLLASFLQVDYRPYDLYQVSAVNADQQSITLRGQADFDVGDPIRYYGGRRARNLVAQVTKVESVQLDDGTTASKLTIDQKPTRDDSDGNIAKLVSVVSYEKGDAGTSENKQLPEVNLGQALLKLAARDQVLFVHPTRGLKQLKIVDAGATDGQTAITVNDTLGDFGTEWFAVPLERRQRFPIPIALAMVLGIALFLGLLHGVLVTRLKLQPFVVTLCGLLFYRGFSRWMVDDQTMGFADEYDNSLRLLGTGKLQVWQAADGSDSFGIPYPFFVLLIVAIVAIIFLNRTVWGRYMLALGRNEEAARYSGINTNRVTMIAYVISAVLAAVGGMLFALDSNSISPSSFGNFYELYAIAAAVLGGCSLRGGEGGIVGVVIGTAVMQTLYNLIVLMKISDKLEFAIIGAVILLGVIADEVVKRFAAQRRAAARARQAAEE
ncbi:ABC transporter permease [Stieleria marina]|uniref:Ribose transport system permease protein RbsC n=1 Tax=Stieleria marina TaxID=1930275 RepID=A0A517NQG2_9BACT|nr:Ribose transport system permease protein RbsC [Planctomycetes bacterium K23_9]